MADYYHVYQSRQVDGRTVLSSSLVAIAMGGPLLGMMGFSFLASATVLLVCSPFLLLFSPLLLGVAFLSVGVLAGFAVAAAMALTGVSMLGWSTRETEVRFGGLNKLGKSGHRMKGIGRDYLTDHFTAATA